MLAEARRIVEQERFAERCRGLVAEGEKAFGKAEWDKKISDLVQVVDKGDPRSVQAYSDLVANALRAGNAHQLLHALSGDLNKAQDLLGMSQVDQAVELTRMAQALQPRKESSAPVPIEPVRGSGAASGDYSPDDPTVADKLTTREWMARRQAQIDKRKPGRAA